MSRADDAPTPRKTKPIEAGQVPASRLGVYRKGILRGTVGPRATSVTASRFTGSHAMKLGNVDGRDAWICDE
jgi:hypothetical protein